MWPADSQAKDTLPLGCSGAPLQGSTRGYSQIMAPVQEHPPPTAEHSVSSRNHEISPQTWSSAGQAVATAAGGAAIFGLVVGPEGAAVAALVGGIIGLVLAIQHARAEQQHTND